MTVEIFDVDTFLSVLPAGSYQSDIEYGEYIFLVPIDGTSAVKIRSSITQSGESADSGENSIRLYLWNTFVNKFLGKIDTYTTRVKGWEKRLLVKIEYMKALRDKAGDCPECMQPKLIFLVSKEGANKGRPFCKCMDCDSGFAWLDKPTQPFHAYEQHGEGRSKETSNDLTSVLEDMDREYSDDQKEPTLALSIPKQSYPPNEEQKLAIEAPFTAVRVEAGPGSGKTYTIARRYKYYVDNGISMDKIVAVTFNTKMASELGLKIAELVPEVAGTKAERQICTIHALCLRFLKDFYPKYRTYQIAPEWWIKKQITSQLETLFTADNRPCYDETRDVIWNAKNQGYDADHSAMFYANLVGSYYADKIQKIHDFLDTSMEDNRYITFIDMLLLVELGLERDTPFLTWTQSNVDALIIDEAQDTNSQSMRILAKLAEKTGNIFIVGDRDQLLYRFTGATPEANLGDGFESRYPSGLSFPLVVNYRSTQRIVHNSRTLIDNNYQPFGPYELKYLKALRPMPSAPEGVDFSLSYYPNAMSEALAVRDQVAFMIEKGSSPGDFFIGFRTRAQGGYLEYAFAQTDIPFVNTTGMSFWTLHHIQDVLTYIRLAIVKENTEEDFKRVMNIPTRHFTVPWKNHPDYGEYINHRFLGNAFVAECEGKTRNIKTVCMRTFKFSPGGSDMLSFLKDIENVYYLDGIGETIRYIVDQCYRKYVLYEAGNSENQVGEGSKIEDLLTAAEVADTFDSYESFSEYVSRIIEASKAQESGVWDGKVVLSTIHRLKGLERDYVYGVGISEYDPRVQGNIPSGLLPHTFSMVQPPSEGIFDIYGMGRIEDERCLFYVLVTRAKKQVFLSTIRAYRKCVFRPSRFLDELRLTDETD